MAGKKSRQERQKELSARLQRDPFLTDGELSALFDVSVATIRLDRASLGISQYRDRVRHVAYKKQSGFSPDEGDTVKTVDFSPKTSGVYMVQTDKSMTFPGTDIVRGCYIYSFAETLAIKLIDQQAAIIDVANIKYKSPIVCGSKLMARSQVIRTRDNECIVWVKIDYQKAEVFRCKFILRAVQLPTKEAKNEDSH